MAYEVKRTSEAGLKLIKQFEGFSPTVYKCAAGWQTIGFGHVLKKEEEWTTISPEEAEMLLKEDILIAEQAVARFTSCTLLGNQFDALVSFTFNLGAGALQASKLRRKVNAGLHQEVPEEFLRWIYAGGRRLPGLLRRRQAEAQLYAQ